MDLCECGRLVSGALEGCCRPCLFGIGVQVVSIMEECVDHETTTDTGADCAAVCAGQNELDECGTTEVARPDFDTFDFATGAFH